MIKKEDIKNKLKYIGLDLDNIPEELINFNSIEFKPSKIIDEIDSKIYRYIPISKIEILLTPHSNGEKFSVKYKDAVSLNSFLKEDGEKEEEVKNYLTFLNMLNNFSENKIEEIENMQNIFMKKEPFNVAYKESVFWNIYYSEKVDRYFMLVCTDESDFSNFFYILKKKLEYLKKKEKAEKNDKEVKEIGYIYTNIKHLPYTEKYLNKEEMLLLENNLWYFTKHWPVTYEFIDKNGELKLVVTGIINIYDDLKSEYRIVINSKEEGVKISNLVKALFTLETETEKYLSFYANISSSCALNFYSNKGFKRNDQENANLEYKDLTEFLFLEYDKLFSEYIMYVEENNIKKLRQEILVHERKAKEERLLELQNEITLFSEARKSLFGKFRYFLKKNPLDRIEETEKAKKEEELKKIKEKQQEETDIDKKKNENEEYKKFVLKEPYCTIEEYLILYKEYDKVRKNLKNNMIDINTLKLAIKNIDKKIENSRVFLKEVGENKKNLFGFFKYTNSSHISALAEGEIEKIEEYELKKESIFDINLDFDIFGEKQDKKIREELTKEELETLYLTTEGMLKYINMIKTEEVDIDILTNYLKELKNEYEKSNIDSENYDIFGSITNTEKIRYIKDKSFRETDRNKFKSLKFNKDITLEEFYDKLKVLNSALEEAVKKITAGTKMNVYRLGSWSSDLKIKKFDIYNIDINDELRHMNSEDVSFNLFKLRLNENVNMLPYTNIAFYNNNNKTLPCGMDISSQCIIDMSKHLYIPIKEEKRHITVFKDKEKTKYKANTINIKEFAVDKK